MILNDFSGKYRIFTYQKTEASNGIVVTPKCFNYIGITFPTTHSQIVFCDGNDYYSGSHIYRIEEVE